MSAKKNVPDRVKRSVQEVTTPAINNFEPNYWLAGASAFAGFFLYVNTIFNQYVLDDAFVITQNPYVMRGFGGIKKLLTISLWQYNNVNVGYYRPLSLVTFAIENQFFPGNPHVSHLDNIILFALSGFFLCLLLMRIFRHYHQLFSFFIALLFIAHPIHTEVIANIKSRDEILSFLNLVVSLYLMLRALGSKTEKVNYPMLALSVIFFYLGLLSKETAFTGILLVPLLLFFTGTISAKKILLISAPFIAVAILFQVQKYYVTGPTDPNVFYDLVNFPYNYWTNRLPGMFMLFLKSFWLLIIPYPLSYSYAYNQIPAVGMGSVEAIGGMLLMAACIYVGLRNILKKPVLNLGILILGITLAPLMAFTAFRGGIFAERLLFAPAVGFSIIVVWVLMKISKFPFGNVSTTLPMVSKNRVFSIPFIAVLLAYSIITVLRNAQWHDNLTLYSHDVETAPNSCQVHLHYAVELSNNAEGELDRAKAMEMEARARYELRRAMAIYPGYIDAYIEMGRGFQNADKNYDSAIYYCNLAIANGPHYSLGYRVLGTVYESMGKQQLASYYYNKAVELDPNNYEGVNYRDMHRKKTGLDIKEFPSTETRDDLESSTPEKERDFMFYNKLGAMYGQKGDLENSVRCLQKAVQLNPGYTEAKINLATGYAIMKKFDSSIAVLNNVLAQNPADKRALQTLALDYANMGNDQKAKELMGKANQLSGK